MEKSSPEPTCYSSARRHLLHLNRTASFQLRFKLPLKLTRHLTVSEHLQHQTSTTNHPTSRRSNHRPHLLLPQLDSVVTVFTITATASTITSEETHPLSPPQPSLSATPPPSLTTTIKTKYPSIFSSSLS